MKKIMIGLGIGLVIFCLIVWLGKNNQPKIETRSKTQDTRIEEKKETMRFAVMADVHNDVVSLKKAVEMVGNELVVVAGDLTINGTEKEEVEVKNVLDGKNYAVVPGNHDDYKNVWVFGKKFQSIKEKEFKLILIDNSSWRGLGETQKIWIEKEVVECRVLKCVVVMHMPLENSFSKHVMGEYSQITAEQAGWLKEVLLKNNVKTGYSGHLHYSSSYTIGGWQTVLVGAISKERNTQTSRYTEVVVYDDGSLENNVKLVL